MIEVTLDHIMYYINEEHQTASVFKADKDLVAGAISIPSCITYHNQQYPITHISNWAFKGCSGLTSVTIPDSVTSIGMFAFFGCTGLISLTIPESVRSIETCAFEECGSLTSVTIGESVTSIGDGAFAGCKSVYEITCKAVKTPDAYDSTFEEVSPHATLYVPEESIKQYKLHPVWSRFYDIQALTETETAIENTEQEVSVYPQQKVIRNGQVMILCDGDYYNMLGQKCE